MKKITFILLSALAILQVNAQKLPNVQQVGLRAPANVKVDGKANEWGDKFQAYNRATDVFYTIANNNDELCLIVHANTYAIINKIMVGGVTLTVKKNTAENSITFPAYDANSTNHLDFNLTSINGKSAEETDAIVTRNNRIQKGKHKLIKVKGIGGVDTLLSVYNESGIRVAALFDAKNAYALEMAIGLKPLGLSINDANIFSYQIKLNGEKFFPMVLSPVQPNGMPPTAETVEMFAKANERLAQPSSATYFEGKYILVK